MNGRYTNRGFLIFEGKDLYGGNWHIQKSSLATEDAIWIGLDNAEPKIMGGTGWVDYPLPEDVFISTCVHLNRDQVEEILPLLSHFVETGKLPAPPEEGGE